MTQMPNDGIAHVREIPFNNKKTSTEEQHTMSEETERYILEHRNDDVRQLALKRQNNSSIDMAYALQQIDGWQRAKTKLPTWAATDGIIFPPHISMEQCSSEATATYKQNLAKGAKMADLTGGFGVDFSFLSRNFSHATYVERQEHLCQTAQHNFCVLGLNNTSVVCSDAETYLNSLTETLDLIYLDPARRDDNGKKTYAITDCTPDVVCLMPSLLQHARKVIIKLSPMLDITEAVNQLGCIDEVHVISVKNECKEMLLVANSEAAHDSLKIVCVNDDSIYTANETREEKIGKYASNPIAGSAPEVGDMLLVPNASVMKVGCFSSLTDRFDIQKLDPNTHLFVAKNADFIEYTKSTLLYTFPGKIYQISAVSSMNSRDLRNTLNGITHANIAVRNYPMTADQIRKKLKLKDGGDTYIFITRMAQKHIAIITKKIS